MGLGRAGVVAGVHGLGARRHARTPGCPGRRGPPPRLELALAGLEHPALELVREPKGRRDARGRPARRPRGGGVGAGRREDARRGRAADVAEPRPEGALRCAGAALRVPRGKVRRRSGAFPPGLQRGVRGRLLLPPGIGASKAAPVRGGGPLLPHWITTPAPCLQGLLHVNRRDRTMPPWVLARFERHGRSDHGVLDEQAV
mmetsp:Transcript_55813/g.126851  ORF Transcript_55813/g.126851 Transcript_55813/m.126851 type:complete len:201 (-) Transcript_55813:1759-2361(-)